MIIFMHCVRTIYNEAGNSVIQYNSFNNRHYLVYSLLRGITVTQPHALHHQVYYTLSHKHYLSTCITQQCALCLYYRDSGLFTTSIRMFRCLIHISTERDGCESFRYVFLTFPFCGLDKYIYTYGVIFFLKEYIWRKRRERGLISPKSDSLSLCWISCLTSYAIYIGRVPCMYGKYSSVLLP